MERVNKKKSINQHLENDIKKIFKLILLKLAEWDDIDMKWKLEEFWELEKL